MCTWDELGDIRAGSGYRYARLDSRPLMVKSVRRLSWQAMGAIEVTVPASIAVIF